MNLKAEKKSYRESFQSTQHMIMTQIAQTAPTQSQKSSYSTTEYSSSDIHWTTDSDSNSDVSLSLSIGFRFYSGLRHWMISPTTDTDVNTDSDDRRKSWDDKESNTTTDDSDDMGERLVLLHYHYYDMTENSQLFERQKRLFHLAKVNLLSCT